MAKGAFYPHLLYIYSEPYENFCTFAYICRGSNVDVDLHRVFWTAWFVIQPLIPESLYFYPAFKIIKTYTSSCC